MRFSFPLLSVSLFLLLSAFNFTPIQTGYYLIQTDSKLYIEGSSNINTFKCHSEQTFPEKKFSLSIEPNGRLRFQHTKLLLNSTALDCGHRGINRDMHNTLKSDEFPQITIELQYIDCPEPLATKGSWTTLPVMAHLRIAGVERPYLMKVQVQKQSEHLFRIKSTQAVSLAAFNLQPPSPLMGLIQVNDQITIHFELGIQILPD